MYSAVAPSTGDSFSLILPEVNTQMMNIFLTHFQKHIENKKIVLIMDRAGWHCSKKLKIPSQIELIYMPPYSPELNPVERLWKWLRETCLCVAQRQKLLTIEYSHPLNL